MGYRFLDHMTDAYIEAYGNTLEEAFEDAAKGVVDTMVSIDQVEASQEHEINVEGHDLESLLYNWLDSVMLKLLVDKVALSKFNVSIGRNDGEHRLHAVAKGESLDLEKHKYKVEIKGVTYHMMEVQTNDENRVRFLLDL